MRFTRIADGEVTAYTVGVERLEPDADSELEPAGYHSPQLLYAVMTPGAVVADYDVHRLARNLPGDAGWVVDELRDLDYDELAGSDAPEADA
ncbi:hypothetical protein [Halorubrum lipolyticum]|uniref:Uncharacterized protein n=1 Tax=Halorubrum lipolyticum DSM 21995 TaxID=1227482 RepID=M0NKM5_9EURY|nr:hypothetical protein [Halorubrum lipolyticum]EMA57240.1 hypothetical protein C469_15948 [Halorubrum lipolyticum DSM 21995]